MLELPGLIGGENTREDLEALRRYLGRLIPELEQQLINAQQDNYQEELNKRINQVTGVTNGTTAGALAEHVRDFNNPHRVTLSQLGFSMSKLISMIRTDHGAMIRIGEKKGLQINFQTVEVTIEEWMQDGGTAHTEQPINLGQWEMEMPELMAVQITVMSNSDQDVWAGAVKGATGKSIGSVMLFTDCSNREYTETSEIGDEETETVIVNSGVITDQVRTVQLSVIGWGVFGYGGQ